MVRRIKTGCSVILLALVYSGFLAPAKCFCQVRCIETSLRATNRGNNSATVQALKANGFSSQVAAKLARDLPEISQKLIQLPKSKGGAVTLYKGLAKPPNKVNLDVSLYRDSQLWFSSDQLTAWNFARVEKGEIGTVIEVEVPVSFFSSTFDSARKDSAQLVNNGIYDGTLSKYEIQNLAPFIKRVGVVGAAPGLKEDQIRWISFDDALKAGFFKDHFNYKKYFAPK